MIIRKRNSAKKSITLGIASLSLISLASVGFAAWVISGGDSKDVSGTITVDTVENNLHAISEIKWANSVNPTTYNEVSGKIYFGMDNTTLTSTSTWLNNTSEDKEQLSDTVQIKVSNVYKTAGSSEEEEPEVTINAELKETSNGSQYSAALTAQVVGDLPTKKDSEQSGSEAGIFISGPIQVNNSRDATYTIKVQFAWGTAFNSENPAKYAEEMASSSSDYWDLSKKSSFASALETIYKLNECKFTLTITTN